MTDEKFRDESAEKKVEPLNAPELGGGLQVFELARGDGVQGDQQARTGVIGLAYIVSEALTHRFFNSTLVGLISPRHATY
jgi:hypothetical protein